MMSSRFGLDNQTVFGMPPTEHVRIAAELGCGSISVAHAPVPWRLDRYPSWSLLDDPALLAETRAALRDTGIRIALVEGFTIRPETDAQSRLEVLDLMADLGAERIGVVAMEPDPERALEQMGMLADLAGERGMGMAFEYAPPHTFNTLAKVRVALRAIGKANVRLLIDSMHFFRSGSTVDELASVPPEEIGYIQLSDTTLACEGDNYYGQAIFERLPPGMGELPLVEFLAAIPGHVPIGLEVPRQALLQTRAEPRAVFAEIVEAARKVLDAAAIP